MQPHADKTRLAQHDEQLVRQDQDAECYAKAYAGAYAGAAEPKLVTTSAATIPLTAEPGAAQMGKFEVEEMPRSEPGSPNCVAVPNLASQATTASSLAAGESR